MLTIRLKKGIPSLTTQLMGENARMLPGNHFLASEEDWLRLKNYCEIVEDGFRVVKKEHLRIYVPDGIGDLHWVFLKLGAVKEACKAKKITLVIRDLTPIRPIRAEQFVEMNPIVDEIEYTKDILSIPPSGISVEIEGYDYHLDATPVLLRGKRIESWLPELPVNYDYPMNLPVYKRLNCAVVSPGDKRVEKTWAGEFSSLDWARIIMALKNRTEVVVIGMDQDYEKVAEIRHAGAEFIDMTNKTDFKEVYRLAMGAKALVASVSGLPIVAASRGGRVVCLWPGEKAENKLHKNFRTSWIRNNPNYIPVSYDEGPKAVMSAIAKVWRQDLGKFYPLKKLELNVLIPATIEDVYLFAMKARGLKTVCFAVKINLFLDGEENEIVRDFAQSVPQFKKVEFRNVKTGQQPGGFTVDHLGFDYIFTPWNEMKKTGYRIEEWLPEILTEFKFKVNWHEVKTLNSAVVMMGSLENAAKNTNGWGITEWVELIKELGKRGKVVALGLPEDKAYAEEVKKAGAEFIDMVGKLDFYGMLRIGMGSRVVVASAAGMPMLMASRGARVLMLWPGEKAQAPIRESVRDAWIGDSTFYVALSYEDGFSRVMANVSRLWRP